MEYRFNGHILSLDKRELKSYTCKLGFLLEKDSSLQVIGDIEIGNPLLIVIRSRIRDD